MTNKHKLAYQEGNTMDDERNQGNTGRTNHRRRQARRGFWRLASAITVSRRESVILEAFPPAMACVNGNPLPRRMTDKSCPGDRRPTILHSGTLSLFVMFFVSVAAHAQSPAGPNRPISVPDGYLITPFGYFHPSCVRELAEGDTLLSDVPAIQHARGTIEKLAACEYPHYTARGKVAVEGFGESAQPAVGGGWIENVNVVAAANTSYGALTATWTVPRRQLPTINRL